MLPEFAPVHLFYLALAIALEIAANVLMKQSHGFARKAPAVAAIVIIFVTLIPGAAELLDVGRTLPAAWNDSSLPAALSMLLLVAILGYVGLKPTSKPVVRPPEA